VQDVGNIGLRHENSRRFYLSVVSALFVFLSMAGDKGPFQLVQGRVLNLVAAVGILLSLVWILHMQSFAALYDAKFAVLKEIETKPGFYPIFDQEYLKLKADVRYNFPTLLDSLIPLLFIVVFVAVLYLK
jgi:hypothetical protein